MEAMAPNWTYSHYILHHHVLEEKKKSPVSLKNALEERVNYYYILSICFLNSLCDKWEVNIKHCCCISKYNDYFKEKHYAIVWIVN